MRAIIIFPESLQYNNRSLIVTKISQLGIGNFEVPTFYLFIYLTLCLEIFMVKLY